MAGQFLSPTGEDLQKIYVDDYALIDQYAATGSLWGWGRNINGVIGKNTITDYSSPVQTVAAGTNWKQVSTNYAYSTAIKTDGTLWTWGDNTNGQLGTNNITPRSSPVQTVSGGTNWKLVYGGQYHTAAIKTDGTLWLWGKNSYGQLGDGTSITHRSSPIQTVSGGTNWKQVITTILSTAAIKTDGTLWLWGQNNYGMLGLNTYPTPGSVSSPIQTIAGGTNWKQINAGYFNMAAIKTDGTLWTWGDNTNGQLGTNNITHRSSPIQTVAGGTNWKQVSCGDKWVAAIKTDGTLWTWGKNDYGQLGDGTSMTHRSSPIQTVSGGTNWKQVDGGVTTTAGIKTDGSLWLWGRNNYGEIGNNTNFGNFSSPVQTVAAGTNWKQVSVGANNAFAIYFYDAGNLYPSA